VSNGAALVLGGCAAGDVTYDHVTYEYEPGSVVLKDVSFTVPGGQTIAFVVSGRIANNSALCEEL